MKFSTFTYLKFLNDINRKLSNMRFKNFVSYFETEKILKTFIIPT